MEIKLHTDRQTDRHMEIKLQKSDNQPCFVKFSQNTEISLQGTREKQKNPLKIGPQF